VGEAEVKEKNLDQVPVLFVVKVVDKKYLQFLYFFQSLTKFHNDEQSKIYGDFKVTKEVQYQD
jgi:hypothetical protein